MFYSVAQTQILRWAAAITALKNGSRNARLLLIGDSTTWGKGANSNAPSQACYTQSVPAQLPGQITAITPRAQLGLALPYHAIYNDFDDRFSLGANWFANTFGVGTLDFDGTNSTATTTFAASVPCDGFDIYTLSFSSAGILTATATGGNSVAINGAGAQAVVRTNIAAAALSSANVLRFTPSGACHVLAVEPTRTDRKTLYIGNGGVDGSNTVRWMNDPTTFGSIPFIKTYLPDLTIIALGVNDASGTALGGDTVTTPTQFSANISALIAAAKVSGDVILSTMIPSQNANQAAMEQQYIPVLKGLAQSNNLGLIDVNAAFGGSYNALLMSDAQHPNQAGYQKWTALVAAAISPLSSVTNYVPRHARFRR